MSAASISRGARWFVAAGAVFLVVLGVEALLVGSRSTAVALAVPGFVLHTVFGKAYSLVPSYFDRSLAAPRAPVVQFPLTAAGTVALVAATVPALPRSGDLAAVGGVLWAMGVVVFLATVGWTVHDNLGGAETGTGEHNADRRPVDRAANAFVPLALAYLAVGSYALVAPSLGLPALADGYPPRASHLLAAGAAGLLVFAVGFRLLPRFLVAHPPRWLVAVVLPAGALGPALLAAGLPAGPLLEAGGVLEATAVVGFGAAYVTLFVRSERRRVGFYGVLAGAGAGVLGVLVGLSLAFGPLRPGLVVVHYRLLLVGFLGLTVVGVAFQFYPPTVGTFPGADDRTALAAIAGLGAGLLAELAGVLAAAPPLVVAGRTLALLGSALYLFLVVGLFYERHWSG